jgi:glycosyltransferase involved in cell wall biosynthesis
VLTFNSESGFVREERAEIKRKGLDGVIHFLPFTPNVAEVLRGLDVVAMPSLSEACGMLAMEAMVAGVPIIGTNCIGLREVLADTPGIMVNAGDSHALAEALRREMSEQTTEQFKLFQGEAARRFTVDKQAAELESLLTQMNLSALACIHK